MPDTEYPVYESSEVSAREVMVLLRRRRWTVVITLIVFVAGGAFLTSQMTPIYRARATMIIEQSPARTPRMESGGPIGDTIASTAPHSLGTQVEVLQSGPLQAKVIDQLRLTSAEAYPGMMVAQVGDTDIIEVVAQSADPRVAQNAPNLLVAEYIRQSQQDKGASLRQAREYVERKLTEAQQQLATADARLRAFKEQYQLPDLESSRANAISEANSIKEELRKAENELTSLQSQIQVVSAQVEREPSYKRASQTTIPNPEVGRLNAEIQRLQQQRILLVRTYKETEPEVRQVDAQIGQFQRELSRLPRIVESSKTLQLNPTRSSLQDKLDALRTQARGLEPHVALLRGQYRAAQGRLSTFPAWETRVTQLQRDRDLKETEQRELSTELRNLRIREQAQGVLARPLARAYLPRSPVRPQPILNFLVSVALGLVFGVGAACFRDMTDDRLHTVEEAERLLGLPILGRVPSFPSHAPKLLPAHGESPLRDSFRRLRAGVTFAANSDPVRSLMVTSATAGEGKSTTAANLAVAAAVQGRKVILVDADLRNPSLSPLFGIAVEPGLGDVLIGEASLPSALHPTGIRDLLVLPAGSPVPDSAELLAGPKMGELLEELTHLADLVILDTPPCVPIADAEVIGTRVDAAVLVVGLGRTDKEAVRMARELMDQAHVRLLGAVLNRMKAGDHGYYYRYSYGNGHRARNGAAPARLQPATTAVVPEARESVAPAGSRSEENEG